MAAIAPVPDEIAGLAGPPGGGPPSIQVGGGGPPGGAPPPGPPGGGGLPPELMAALGGGGGPEAPPEEAAEGGGSPMDLLADARESMMSYLDQEEDDVDKAKAMQALKLIQDLFAKSQQEEEAASGTTPAMKGMRKALGG